MVKSGVQQNINRLLVNARRHCTYVYKYDPMVSFGCSVIAKRMEDDLVVLLQTANSAASL